MSLSENAPQTLSSLDCTSRDYAQTISRAQREEALLEALGSGWLVPLQLASAANGAGGLVVALDRMPTCRGTTGCPVDVAMRGVATALNWLAHANAPLPPPRPAVVIIDARFMSLVALEALLKQQLVEQLLTTCIRVVRQQAIEHFQLPLQAIVVFRRVDVLAEPLLKAAADRILNGDMRKGVDIVFHAVTETLTLTAASCGASTNSCAIVEEALDVVLQDDGSLFLGWWDALWDQVTHIASAPPSPEASVSRGGSHSRSAFRSPSRSSRQSLSRSRSRSNSTARGGDGDSPSRRRQGARGASSVLTTWQSALHRALHDYIPFRDLIVSEESREYIQLFFWHLHELQCIDTYLCPPQAVELYQSASHLADDEAHIRLATVGDEAQQRRALLDDFMEGEEAVEQRVALQRNLWREEGVARRALETQERRFRDLAVTLKDPSEGGSLMTSLLGSPSSSAPISNSTSGAMSPTAADQTKTFEPPLFPVSLLPNVASLLLLGREFPQEGLDAGSASADASHATTAVTGADDSIVDHGCDADEGASSVSPQESPVRNRRASFTVVDSGSQTASPVDPAPRISSLRASLKRALGNGSTRDQRDSALSGSRQPSEPSSRQDSFMGPTPLKTQGQLTSSPAQRVAHSAPFGSVHFSPSAYTARSRRERAESDVSMDSSAFHDPHYKVNDAAHHHRSSYERYESSGHHAATPDGDASVNERVGSWQRDDKEDEEEWSHASDRHGGSVAWGAEATLTRHHHRQHPHVLSPPPPVDTRRQIMATEDF